MQAAQPISQDMIFNALYTAIELTDSVLQIWLTLTFAVIVSTYVAGKRFDRPIYLLVSGLYALASAIQLIRFCTAAYSAFFYRNWLIERGFDVWPVPYSVSSIIGLSSVVLIFAGTVGTLWFVRATWKSVEGVPDDAERPET
jgi:hypothetical protein